ncbi:MAG TPA: cation:proton antiporter, partial [Bdellovibrionota bacterium]|nr:cation:proton antiporter [Bdellovibrionota bacterium]
MITIVAGLVTLIFRKIKQPVVLGYIVAGIIVGPHTPPFPLVSDLPNVRILADLGVIFLMFYLGLEFSFRKLARVGPTAGAAAVFEVSCMLTLGFFAGQWLGWSRSDSFFLGALISISSTTIIFKALEELGLKSRRFAEIVFGILIVEDLIAILMLAGLTSLAATGSFSPIALATAAGKLALVVGCWMLAGYFLVPRFIGYVGRLKSDEMLVLVSVGLCLCLVVVAAHFQFSAALGAFIMGSILAESTESRRIENLMAPLRDLFAAIFFVSVGMLMDPTAI